MYRGVIVALLLLWVIPGRAGVPPAGGASVDILAGTWIYNTAKSRRIEPDLRITAKGTGSLHAESDSGSYDFDLVGGSHPLSHGRTISWVPDGQNVWRVTLARKDTVLETMTVTLSGNTLHTEKRGKLPNGSPYELNVTYRRAGSGAGLVGEWRCIGADTGATWDAFVISTADDGLVTWRIPTDLLVITGHFDGGDLPVVGPDGPAGSTMALRAVRPREFEYVIKEGGWVTERGTITISPDRRWLTEINWRVDDPQRRSQLVYERDPKSGGPN